MSTVSTPWLVWGRSFVLGAVALGTGTGSHVLGQGHLPGPGAMLVVLGLCVLGSTFFLRVRATPLRLVGLVVAGQTVVHGALSALAGHRGDGTTTAAVAATPSSSEAARPSRFYDHFEAVAAASTQTGAGLDPAGARGDWLAHQVEHLTAQGPVMVVAHLLGAVALGLFLAVGETALWSLLALAVTRALLSSRAQLLCVAAAGVRHGVALRAGLSGVPVVPFLRPALFDRRPPGRRGPPFVLAA